MKKALSIIISIMLVLSLCACAKKEKESDVSGETNLVENDPNNVSYTIEDLNGAYLDCFQTMTCVEMFSYAEESEIMWYGGWEHEYEHSVTKTKEGVPVTLNVRWEVDWGLEKCTYAEWAIFLTYNKFENKLYIEGSVIRDGIYPGYSEWDASRTEDEIYSFTVLSM